MKILFLGRHFVYFRNYEAAIRLLAARGHHVHLAAERDESLGGTGLVEALARTNPGISFGEAPARADDDWAWAAGRVRLGLDYLRYQHPVFDRAHKLRARARERTPGAFIALGSAVRALGGWSRELTSRLLGQLEAALPPDPAVEEYLEAARPDVLLLTPLISLGSSQIEYLRAARRRGIPTALCVWSWDHLSSKALIRESPDRVFVWNETQKQEAVELHGMSPDRVVVTGAQCFDQWFDRAPSRERATFCRQVGLNAGKPFLLYVCSALFGGSPEEAPFVMDWVRRVRECRWPELREAGILVRPHPSRLAEWSGIDTAAAGIVLWGGNPVDDAARADYFDSLFHSAAVIGLNTSAFIEAGIVGRPVHTLVLPQFADNQTATVHFHYLTSVAGGLLEVAHSVEEHVDQLHRSLQDPPRGPKPFVQAFVRPLGLDRPATPVLVDQVEALPGLGARTGRAPGVVRPSSFSRWCLRRLIAARTDARLERWVLSPRELESAEFARDEQQRKAFRRAEERAGGDEARLAQLRARAAAFEDERNRARARRRARDERRDARDLGRVSAHSEEQGYHKHA